MKFQMFGRNYLFSQFSNTARRPEWFPVNYVNSRDERIEQRIIFFQFFLENVFSRRLCVFEALLGIKHFPKQFCVLKFIRLHKNLFPYLRAFPMCAQAFEFAFDFFAMRRVCAENLAASIP